MKPLFEFIQESSNARNFSHKSRVIFITTSMVLRSFSPSHFSQQQISDNYRTQANTISQNKWNAPEKYFQEFISQST